MFEAVDVSGKRILAHLFSIQELRRMSLHCPYCLMPVRVRQGRRVHFAHQSACTGESQLHADWKKRVADALISAGLLVMEEWKSGNRRFDLWIPERNIGVEIQRSPMSSVEWQRRANLDAQAEQTIRWIGFHPSSGVTLKLQGWMRQALLQNGFLDLVVQHQLRRFRHPIPFAKHHVYCTVQSLSLQEFLANDVHPFPRKFSTIRWQAIINRYRERPFYSSFPPGLLRNPLYEAGLTLQSLPLHVFLPLTHLLALPVHPFEFQIAVFLQLRGEYSALKLEQAILHVLKRMNLSIDSPVLEQLVMEWVTELDL